MSGGIKIKGKEIFKASVLLQAEFDIKGNIMISFLNNLPLGQTIVCKSTETRSE